MRHVMMRCALYSRVAGVDTTFIPRNSVASDAARAAAPCQRNASRPALALPMVPAACPTSGVSRLHHQDRLAPLVAATAHSYITHHQQQSVVVSVGFAATVALLGASAAVALAPALATRLLALLAAPRRLPTARTWRCRHQKHVDQHVQSAAKNEFASKCVWCCNDGANRELFARAFCRLLKLFLGTL